MSATLCPPSMLLVRADLGEDGELVVELRRPAQGSLETLDELGLSPVGEYPSWADAPSAMRAAFDDVVDCARERPPPPFATGSPRPRFAPPTAASEPNVREQVADAPPSGPPWLALAGMLGLVVVAFKSAPALRRHELVLVVGLAFSSVVVGATIEWSFFLQNGHGPEWLRYALTGDEALAYYGPGYAELLGASLRRNAAAPEQALARIYLGLSAAMTVLTFVGARSVGARPSLAAALALAVALEPTCLRLVRSAAYHPPIFALNWAATAALVLGVRRASPRAPVFWIAVLAAGLLVAQSARVHPVGWVGAALLPAVIVFVPGHTRTRVVQAVLATGALAAVVALTSLDEVLGPATSGPGHGVLRMVSLPRVVALGASAVVALSVAFVWPTSAVRRGLIVTLLGLGLALAFQLDPMLADLWRYRAGYYSCLAPLLSLGVASLLARFARSRRAQLISAVGVLLVASASAALTGPQRLLPATDALESTLAIGWRERDWGAHKVLTLGNVDGRVVRLPLYVPGGLVARELALDEVETVHVITPTLYYRSSSCSLERGREACAALEARLKLDDAPLFERELPARTSQPWVPMDANVVSIGLYMARPADD